MASTNTTAVIASPAIKWCNGMTAYLKDDDPALPPETLKARLKQRAKLARRKERAVTGEAPLIGGCPTHGDGPKPATLQRRKRKAAALALIDTTDVGLPDFAMGVEAAECTEATIATEAERMAAESAAAESAAVERAATAAAAEAAAEAAVEAAATEAAEQAAAEQAAKRAADEKKAKDAARAAYRLAPTRNDGPRGFATQLKVADAADAADERICCICLEPAEKTVACCGKGMHTACLAQWLQSGGDNWPLGYGENAAYLVGEGTVDMVPSKPTEAWLRDQRLVPHIRADGRPAVTDKKVNTKTCPCCRVPTQSTLRAGLGR